MSSVSTFMCTWFGNWKLESTLSCDIVSLYR